MANCLQPHATRPTAPCATEVRLFTDNSPQSTPTPALLFEEHWNDEDREDVDDLDHWVHGRACG
ncbi:MAG: hypothetical protein KDK97_13720, partial [Verrucomicrobiales bacterium]|nr:hypothetical protein [Verrucomicrobiales bacterium]